MLYFATPTNGTAELMAAGVLGYIDTPLRGNKRPAGVAWCADNGCYSDKFNEQHWWNWLQTHTADTNTCMFAAAPDVVGDAVATLERSRPWLPKIRELGFPAAFVAQDGVEAIDVPWDEFDVLFIGGTNAFKLGPVARRLIGEAKQRGLWVHCGRVNSYKRYRSMEAIGCDSCDGTYLVFGPDINLPKLLTWIQRLHDEPSLFDMVEGA